MKEMANKGNGLPAFSVIIIATALFLLGLVFVPQLPVKLNPSRKLPVVNVSFHMGGQSPLVVEMEVTSKLEGMLSRVRGVRSVSSRSGHGWGQIALRLSEHVDPDLVRFEISTIVRQAWASLPDGVSYPEIRMSGTTEEANHPFLRYTVNAPYSRKTIQEFVEQTIKSRLSEIKGIDRIDVHGASPMILRLKYDYTLLEQYGVSLGDIRSAIQTYLTKEFLGLGKIKPEEGVEKWIRIALVAAEEGQKFDPAYISVKNQDGTMLRLDRLVEVIYEEEEPVSYFRINGMNSIYLSFTAEEGANQITLSKEVQEQMRELAYGPAGGYDFHLTYDASVYLQKEINKIWFRSGLTILILLLFVFITYRNLKYSFLVVFSLLVNVSVAAIFYYLLGIEMQLYSLAGLTISLTLIIDNVIIMTDQIIHRKNKKVFLAIFTATLTTLAALMIIFFMEENIRLNLLDFAWIMIINLVLSLAVALFLVPALIEKLQLGNNTAPQKKRKKRFAFIRGKRMLVWFNRGYGTAICLMYKGRGWLLVALLLLFGIPLFLLPEEIKSKEEKGIVGVMQAKELGFFGQMYNQTLGSQVYKKKIKPTSDMLLGGTMRLFAQKVRTGGYHSGERQETSLSVAASLPNGATREQMNTLITNIEEYLLQYKEIRQFEASVHSGQRGSIRILFHEAYERGQFPHYLRSQLITKVNQLDGGSWSIHGVGDGFNNEMKEMAGQNHIKILGYNYDNLQIFAEAMRDSLLKHRRIKEVIIDSEFSWYKNDYSEYVFATDKQKLIQNQLVPAGLLGSLSHMFEKNMWVDNWTDREEITPIRLSAYQEKIPDIWDLQYLPVKIRGRESKISGIATIEKAQMSRDIAKENQQYLLCLQYDYTGDYALANKVMKDVIADFNRSAPLGYHAETERPNYWWSEGKISPYWLLFLIILIIFFTTSILFNSVRQPFVIIFIIPLSFVGIFLTFYLFELNFDQGGFAAFILLSGTTVNANIYLLNEYNNIRNAAPRLSPLRIYLKAWNGKIRPILLTVVSTILGFIPFIIGPYKESFWFPLAAGTIGGMVASVIALFLFFPLFLKVGKRR